MRRDFIDSARRRAFAAAVAAAATLSAGPGAGPAAAQTQERETAAPPSAVVVMYHRFGEGTLPSTNIRLEQFEAHLAEIARERYHVRPLPEIVAALRAGRPLPDRTVGISVDDAYLSFYREAWPRLREARLPFTLFVATDPIDRGHGNYMSWDQIREVAQSDLATIGSQTASHPHMPVLSRARMRRELGASNKRFRDELGRAPTLFAYPYGEASLAAMREVHEAGFVAAFGQHSGALHPGANFGYLPRFALNETYGDIDRFRLATNALPLYATEVTPEDPTLGPNPPAFGFTVGDAVSDIARLACYSSAHGKLALERLGNNRVEVRPPSAFPPGRGRINCTLPAAGDRWRWFGMQFFIPEG